MQELTLQTCLPLLVAALVAFCVYQWCFGIGVNVRGHRRSPPVASGIPFVGDTFKIIATGPIAVGRKHHAKLGKIYKSWFLGEQIVHIGDADTVKRLLNAEHDLVEESWPFTIRMLMGNKAVTNATGAHHIQTRKILAPALTPKATQQFIPRILEVAEELCTEWAETRQLKGEDAMKAFTFQVATELVVGFGKSFATRGLMSRQQKLWTTTVDGFLSLPINLPGFGFYKALQARQALLNEYEGMIMALINKGDKHEDGELKTSMQMIIEASKAGTLGEMDMEFMKDNAFNLLFAGHDTSASALMLLLRFFQQEPATLQRLRDEQQQVIQSYGGSIDAESSKMMPYADASIKEGLRLTAVAGFAARVALKSFEIGSYTIPKGQKLQLELWKVMEEDSRWAALTGDFAPEVFNPDRWLTEEGQKVGAYLPFGAGARMCPGYHFAQLEIKILLAVLARKYEWQVDLSEPVKPFPLPVPAHGLPMTFCQAQQK